jgi:hypothetical protein
LQRPIIATVCVNSNSLANPATPLITYFQLQFSETDFSGTHMVRPKHKTEVTALKKPPDARDLWMRCATAEVRSLTIMFELIGRTYEPGLGILVVQDTAGADVASEGAS